MRFRLRTLLIAAAIGPLIFFLVAYLFSPAPGKGFFSPDSLEYRTQSNLQFFGTDVSWFHSPYQYHNQRLVDFLGSKGYWKPREATSAGRWIFLFHSSSMWRDGDSSLHRQLFCKSDFWIEWSNKHPDEAAQFWPKVIELLRSGDELRATELLFNTAFENSWESSPNQSWRTRFMTIACRAGCRKQTRWSQMFGIVNRRSVVHQFSS